MKTVCFINFVILVILGYATYRYEERMLRLEGAFAEIKDKQECYEAIKAPTRRAALVPETCNETSKKSGHRVVAEEKVEQVHNPNCQMCIACPGWRFGSFKNGRAFCDTCGHVSDMHPLAKKMFCVFDACICEGWELGEKDPSGFYKCARCAHLEGCHNK